VLTEARVDYVQAAIVGDRPAVARIVGELMAAGYEPRQLVHELFVPVQRTVGAMWADHRCTVGQEHTITGITESVMAAALVGYEPPADKGHIVMVCAEGEWHTLPARMAGELFVQQGWRVTFLGGALPADHLRTYLADLDADAVGVSCTLPSNLPGAARSIATARAAGHTVIAGGGGFGVTPLRAHRLGADGWIGTMEAEFDLTSALFDEVLPPVVEGPWRTLDESRPHVVEKALGWLADRQPSLVAPSAEGLAHMRADLDHAVQFTVASMVCNDPSVLSEYAAWLHQVLRSYGLPIGIARANFDALAHATERLSPTASALLGRMAGP
jgi:methanogenic corrinoid protein MtbC1